MRHHTPFRNIILRFGAFEHCQSVLRGSRFVGFEIAAAGVGVAVGVVEIERWSGDGGVSVGGRDPLVSPP